MLHADAALLPEGWARDVAIEIAPGGSIVAVKPGLAADAAERAGGPVVPGMANVHSHAFQRALVGRTGEASPGGDSFWTWRRMMYALLERMDAEAFEAVAAQTYVEMVKAGYTAVGEFHYVHHDLGGRPYADPVELSRRVIAAAEEVGIALTLLPVFYAHGGFGDAPPAAQQQRFLLTVDAYARLLETLSSDAAARGYALGVAPHSLRAVAPRELTEVVALAAPHAPIHIHAAEQIREVDDCVAWSGARPVEWLLDHAGVDRRWCIVHATHLTPMEGARLAASGAVAGLTPTTEADLGDGTFPARTFVDAGGRFGVGSDSNTIVDPFAELRQLEWSQRLALLARNVLAWDGTAVGEAIYSRAAAGGAQALAQPLGAIAPGRRADLVVLDAAHPAFAAMPVEGCLEASIFGPCPRPVRDVMIGGRWVVRHGRHPREEQILARYRSAILATFAE